jgi:peptidyl-prolyl cis-trans isomerase A (cyclophilin A)
VLWSNQLDQAKNKYRNQFSRNIAAGQNRDVEVGTMHIAKNLFFEGASYKIVERRVEVGSPEMRYFVKVTYPAGQYVILLGDLYIPGGAKRTNLKSLLLDLRVRNHLIQQTSGFDVPLLVPNSEEFYSASPAQPNEEGQGVNRTAQMTNASALLNPAALHEQAPGVFDVKFQTTKGDFTVKVTRAWSPLGADRFYNLAKHHFFDNAAFFRIVPGFIVQFGLSADPKVARVWQSANIKDDKVTQTNKRATVTFATAGPNTRTTQLFINLGNNAGLDGQGFSPFGEVIEGMSVVDQLYSGYGERPDQGQIQAKGKSYLDQNFPKLDIIKATVIEPAAGSAPPVKP